jgi:hypothetical protein
MCNLLTINYLEPIDVSGRNNEMGKFRVNFLLCLLSGILKNILIFGWIPLVLVHSSVWGLESIAIRVTGKGFFDLVYTDDSFKPFFKEPFETLVFVLNDGRCLLLSEKNECAVKVCASLLNDFIKELGYRMEDVEIVIHNHLRGSRFGPQDKRFCWQLSQYGFQGKFLVYSQSRNKTIEYRYEK